jgi:hypothetical protein
VPDEPAYPKARSRIGSQRQGQCGGIGERGEAWRGFPGRTLVFCHVLWLVPKSSEERWHEGVPVKEWQATEMPLFYKTNESQWRLFDSAKGRSRMMMIHSRSILLARIGVVALAQERPEFFPAQNS